MEDNFTIVKFNKTFLYLVFLLIVLASFISWRLLDHKDPLPSWEEGETKNSIIEFINLVTKEGGEHFPWRAASGFPKSRRSLAS